MEADDRVFMLGEDIGVYGGAFGVTGDLYHRFGAERIRDTPISELGIVGAAVGAALAGMRPIVEIQFSDFTTQAMDQIVNQAAKIHFMLGGAATRADGAARARAAPAPAPPPSTRRASRRGSPTCPGLKVVHAGDAPRTPRACCSSAIDDPNPVIVLEHKLLYRTSGPVPGGGRAGPARQGRRTPHAARDLTIVATGVMVSRALEAAETLAAEGIDVSVHRPAHAAPARRRPDPRGRLAHRPRAARAGGARPRRLHRRDRRADRRVADDLPAARADQAAQRPRRPDPLRPAARDGRRPAGRRHRRGRPTVMKES